MPAQVTSVDLRSERGKLEARLQEISSQVEQTSDLALLQALAAERSVIAQSLQALDQRLQVLRERERAEAGELERERNREELAKVEKDYFSKFSKLRKLVEEASALAPDVLQLQGRHVSLGGGSWLRYALDPLWVRSLKALVELWLKQDRRQVEAEERHRYKLASRREQRLAQLERQQQAEQEQAAIDKRIADRNAKLWGVRADG